MPLTPSPLSSSSIQKRSERLTRPDQARSDSSAQPLVDEVYAKEMQYQTPKHEIRKSPLPTDLLEFLIVRRVRLDA